MKTAVLTGASSGIGLEITKILLKNDIKVYGFGRNFKNADIKSEYFFPVICDITDINKLCTEIEKIKKENSIDILINNAGVGYFSPHEEINIKKIHEMICVNLEAPIVLTKLLLRDIKKNKGIIINMSSVTAKKINTHGCCYGATKAGLTSFSNSLFNEIRKYGVKVITIHPDITKTNFYRNSNFCQGDSEQSYIYPTEIASVIESILNMRDGILFTDITIQPQKHQLTKK